jgi:hypothetical protein
VLGAAAEDMLASIAADRRRLAGLAHGWTRVSRRGDRSDSAPFDALDAQSKERVASDSNSRAPHEAEHVSCARGRLIERAASGEMLHKHLTGKCQSTPLISTKSIGLLLIELGTRRALRKRD